MILDASVLPQLPATVRRPAFDPATLKPGLVHLGIGAFHRAHQAVFTEDAIAHAGGDWGIVGASLQRADVPDALQAQEGLYAVETLGDETRYRVMGVMRQALFAPRDAELLRAALSAPQTHAVTMTLSEKGYCLDGSGALDLTHPDILADLAAPETPRSAIGWLALGLELRRMAGAGPLTILSCDNLKSNGAKLGGAVTAFAARAWPALAAQMAAQAAFPLTLVDCIVPASDAAHQARVAHALECEDRASVQREEFAQWVIEDKFAGPVPAWGAAGAEIVPDIDAYQRLKLHVLNGALLSLAYLGLPRGYTYTRQAIGDQSLAAFVDLMMAEEIGPALAPLDVAGYWRAARVRLCNPAIGHRLAQIAEDGSIKLRERLFPLLIDNVRHGRGVAQMAGVVRAWLSFMAATPSPDPANALLTQWAAAGALPAAALDNPALFPAPFRDDARLRQAILER